MRNVLGWAALGLALLACQKSQPPAKAASPLQCDKRRCRLHGPVTKELVPDIRAHVILAAKPLALSKRVNNETVKSLVLLKDELRILEIFEAEGAPDLSPLRELQKLESLKLVGLKNFEQAAPVSGIVGLRRLSLSLGRVGPGGGNFQVIQPLQELEEFTLNRVWTDKVVTDLGGLAGKARLRKLQLEGAYIKDLGPLAALPNLEDLSLSRARVEDLSALARLKKLKRLDLGYVPAQDLTPVGSLGELTYLRLASTQFKDYAPLAKLTKLEYLAAGASKIESLSFLRSMPNLKNLGLQQTTAKGWEALAAVNALEFLDVQKTSFSDLALLEGMPRLRWLDVSKCTLTSPASLAKLAGLEHLFLNGSKGVDDPLVLKALPRLRRLFVHKGQYAPEALERLKAAKPGLMIRGS